ncbi:hypothetical protein XELAEV_18041844mg [Xenopus laevis]|uniref:GIY-YIG domain-containing protein n=1 Tax=Xenopus laevis TaxID=8355 RepID=A0A974C304_XENLA|nr:hypothetical protein XELAEV_18041844mg [Xenopus laevis]
MVVYMQCDAQGSLYVGQTTRQVRDRIREHKSAIKTKKVDQAVVGHFVEIGHGIQQLKFQVVDPMFPHYGVGVTERKGYSRRKHFGFVALKPSRLMA